MRRSLAYSESAIAVSKLLTGIINYKIVRNPNYVTEMSVGRRNKEAQMAEAGAVP